MICSTMHKLEVPKTTNSETNVSNKLPVVLHTEFDANQTGMMTMVTK